MLISIITAMDKNQLIGKENGLPWHLPADLQFFKRSTLGKPIVMGRKTFESIGRPLPGRQNIIVSRNQNYAVEGCDTVTSLDQAIRVAGDVDELMIIGGANFYEQTLPRADRLYLTLVQGEFDGDAWFPEIDFNQWQLIEREDHSADEKNECDYSFQVYQRINRA